MKLSNLVLSVVASLTLGIGIGVSIPLVSQQSATAVISIPAEPGVQGGGFTVKVPEKLTHKQAELLAVAYSIAKQDGHRYPQLLQGIILQESKAGELPSYKVAGQEYGLAPNQRYYGVAQIKLVAAREVLNKNPQMWKDWDFHTKTDEEVIAKLIENDRFNLAVASKYLLILRDAGYTSMQSLAVAYNKGAGGATGVDPSTNDYALAVFTHIQDIKSKKVAVAKL
jgi:hypothetical protein